MQKATLEITTTNAAFGGDEQEAYNELARILRKLADSLEAGREPDRVMDYNGNPVGKFAIFD